MGWPRRDAEQQSSQEIEGSSWHQSCCIRPLMSHLEFGGLHIATDHLWREVSSYRSVSSIFPSSQSPVESGTYPSGIHGSCSMRPAESPVLFKRTAPPFTWDRLEVHLKNGPCSWHLSSASARTSMYFYSARYD